MLVLVYHKCSTCQKALKWLDEHKIFFEERPIIEENPTYEELKEWYEKSGEAVNFVIENEYAHAERTSLPAFDMKQYEKDMKQYEKDMKQGVMY